MKKMIVIMLSVLMVFGLAACGSQDDNSRVSAPEPANEESGAETVQDSYAQQQEEAEEASAEMPIEEVEDSETSEGKTLVVYYSSTGHTENVANYIAEATGGQMFKLEPVEEYSSADLDWTDKDSRVSREHENPDDQVIELVESAVLDWDSYDTVFIGYPIWWGIAAWPVNGFVADNDFTGKTVIPFCTSASSGLGESGELLAEMAGTGEWLAGERFRSGASEETVREWVESLPLE